MDKHIEPVLLEKALRGFGGALQDCRVESKSVLAPHIVNVSGSCLLNGQPKFWEAEFNLREIGGPEDIIRLAGMILKSFDKAKEVA